MVARPAGLTIAAIAARNSASALLTPCRSRRRHCTRPGAGSIASAVTLTPGRISGCHGEVVKAAAVLHRAIAPAGTAHPAASLLRLSPAKRGCYTAHPLAKREGGAAGPPIPIRPSGRTRLPGRGGTGSGLCRTGTVDPAMVSTATTAVSAVVWQKPSPRTQLDRTALMTPTVGSTRAGPEEATLSTVAGLAAAAACPGPATHTSTSRGCPTAVVAGLDALRVTPLRAMAHGSTAAVPAGVQQTP